MSERITYGELAKELGFPADSDYQAFIAWADLALIAPAPDHVCPADLAEELRAAMDEDQARRENSY